jgi:hypothetical protein
MSYDEEFAEHIGQLIGSDPELTKGRCSVGKPGLVRYW